MTEQHVLYIYMNVYTVYYILLLFYSTVLYSIGALCVHCRFFVFTKNAVCGDFLLLLLFLCTMETGRFESKYQTDTQLLYFSLYVACCALLCTDDDGFWWVCCCGYITDCSEQFCYIACLFSIFHLSYVVKFFRERTMPSSNQSIHDDDYYYISGFQS